MESATNPFEDEGGEFIVLVNDEGQHSLWPAGMDIPNGWSPTGPRGARAICLAWVEEHWTDMRPRSLTHPSRAGSSSKSRP
jgi:uncharacterized protein YbdZ (MbtH family)